MPTDAKSRSLRVRVLAGVQGLVARRAWCVRIASQSVLRAVRHRCRLGLGEHAVRGEHDGKFLRIRSDIGMRLVRPRFVSEG